MSLSPSVLFVGIGTSAASWYRCALPARALGGDWVGVRGAPPALTFHTGEARQDLRSFADFAGYDVVVLQQPRGNAWIKGIRELQAAGTNVLFEIDDYAHGVPKAKGHGLAGAFGKETLVALELAMRACDGIICSTDYIARRYRSFNPDVWVCQNGIDLGRYALTRPPRDSVTIGWAGSTGHQPALLPWLAQLTGIMDARPNTRFLSVGERAYAVEFATRFGAERAIGLPWMALENYPAAMSNFDIALAPATNSAFFRGKSDLRWLEASALGIAVVADPVVYPAIEHGVTGLHAATPTAAREAIVALIEDPELRARIGGAARAYVREHRSSAAVAPQWAAVFEQVTARAQAA